MEPMLTGLGPGCNRYVQSAGWGESGKGIGMVRRLALVLLVAVACWHGSPASPAAAQSWGPAILGGTYADWRHALGPLVKGTDSGVAGWHDCHVYGDYQLLVSFPSKRAQNIEVMQCPGRKDLSRDEKRFLIARYAPSDGKRHGTLNGGDYGMVPLYVSRTLARSFPLDEFQDCDGKQLPAGSYTVDTYVQGTGGVLINAGGCP